MSMAARCGSLARSAKFAFHSLKAVAEAGGRSTKSAATASACKNTLGNDSSRFRSSFVSYSRLPAELGCAMSMMPLHNAMATARLTSHLSLNSRNCSALSQGDIGAVDGGYLNRLFKLDGSSTLWQGIFVPMIEKHNLVNS